MIKKSLSFSFKSSFLCVFFLIAILVSNDLFAQTLNPIRSRAVRDQDWIIRRQQNEIRQKENQQRKEAIEKERKRKKKETESKDSDELISQNNENCFFVEEVILIDAESLTKRRLNKIVKPFLHQCFHSKLIDKIVAEIESYYHKNGFILAQISVPQQNIKAGHLILKVFEGKISKITLGKDRFVDKIQEFMAFSDLEGEILNIKDIDQGIFQINRLSSNNAALKIVPGKNDGEADILISNKKKFPASATISHDNLGNEFTGVKRTNFIGSLDNLLFLNDNINIHYSTNLNDNSQEREIKSFSSSISIPFAYNTISYSYSRSEFRGQVEGNNGPLKLTGYSDRTSVTLDRVLFSEKDLRISLDSSLTLKESATDISDQRIETSERKLTIANVGLIISEKFKNNISIYLNPSYSRGLKILNANQDEAGISADTPRSQFQLYKFYGSISKRFILPNDIFLNYSTEFDSQISKDTLFGSEQFSVGGYYSVRGFRENFITGDHGYYFRNKINLNLGQLLAPLKISNKISNQLYKFSIEPFYDYGYTKFKISGDSGRLSGTGLKAIFYDKYFTASMTYSWAIGRSVLIESDRRENHLLYFEISVTPF